jgi:hypothetical protein
MCRNILLNNVQYISIKSNGDGDSMGGPLGKRNRLGVTNLVLGKTGVKEREK